MNVQINPLPTEGKTRTHDGDGDGGGPRKYLIGGAALVLALGGFWYFTHSGSSTKPKRNLAAPVKVAPVEQRAMAVIERTIGTVVANSTVSVNARVQGQLTKAFFKEGQMVKTGDLLFQIDPRPYQATYDNAEASMASAKAKFDRYSRLKSQNAISPQDVDDAQAAYLEAKALAESARLNLEFTAIRSPVNGKTGPILIQPGNMVMAASSGSVSATPLVTINEIQPVKISLSLPQSDLPRIQARQRTRGLIATIRLEGGNGETLSAPVDFIGNAVINTTGTIELRATFKNENLSLVPGQLVDVSVELDSIPNAIIVPHDAVNQGPDGAYVYAVADGKALLKPVTVQFDDSKFAAVEGDLATGAPVVVDGQLRVVPGTAVFVEAKQPTQGSAEPRKRRTS
jgi:membrane fusion protein, multidrug efflux system